MSSEPAYREHVPHPALRRYVECYWSVRGGGPVVAGATRGGPVDHATNGDPARALGTDAVDRVLPDGCMDAIFSLSGPDDPDRGLPTATSIAVGTMTEPLAVPRAPEAHLWGVRFRPGAGAAFLGTRAVELTDSSVSLDTLWGRRRADEACQRLMEAEDDDARPGIVDRLLRGALSSVEAQIDLSTLLACEAVTRSGGRVRVEEIARVAGLSRRQLERRFAATVGIPPKVACRVARMRRTVDLLDRADPHGLAEIAMTAGYADQAHFTREFRALTGTTPGVYRDRGGGRLPPTTTATAPLGSAAGRTA